MSFSEVVLRLRIERKTSSLTSGSLYFYNSWRLPPTQRRFPVRVYCGAAVAQLNACKGQGETVGEVMITTIFFFVMEKRGFYLTLVSHLPRFKPALEMTFYGIIQLKNNGYNFIDLIKLQLDCTKWSASE